MVAAAAGEWYKIVSDVAGTPIPSSLTGSAGYSYISALAIADCIDGMHDLGAGTGTGTLIAGNDWSGVNTTLRNWAGAAGKSALPYLADNAGSSGYNDYETACGQNSEYDLTLGSCTDLFYLNHKVCAGGDTNWSWAAAGGDTSGSNWVTHARVVGYHSCPAQGGPYYVTSDPSGDNGFRVVVRP